LFDYFQNVSLGESIIKKISITLSNLNNIDDIFTMDSSFVAIKNKGKLANKVKGLLRLDIIVCGGTTRL